MLAFLKKTLLALGAALAMAAPAGAADTGHIQAELVAQEAGAVPGGVTYVALRQDIDRGWHTYWRNPGDSGEATQIAWTLPEGWSAGDIVWPAPSRQPAGPLLNYGYSGKVLLPVPIHAPADARPGTTVTLRAAVAFLVCAEICIPEDAVLTLDLPVVAQPAGLAPRWGEAIGEVLAAAPKPAGLKAAFRREGDALKLAVAGAPLAGADLSGAWFFPYSGKVIAHAAPQRIERGPEGLTFTLVPGHDFTEGRPPAELSGVVKLKGGAYEVAAAEGPPPPGASGLGPPGRAARTGLPLALFFAFLGGLILNLMPCVFPILSMKAASLAGHAHETRGARLQGLVFLAGVLAAFLTLAGLLIAAKAAGGAIGWGFQLQSPAVVAALSLIMLLVALNLSGLFEVGTSVQGVGGTLASRQGLAGSFFTGALAVVVAAPCTAPFMAPALGYALTRSAPETLAVFAVLGLGLALPYVALSFAPSLLRRLPPPGSWMQVLRRGLAFPMYGAAAWLVWVLAQQSGPAGLARLFAAAVVAAFAAWLFGIAQRRSDSAFRFSLMGLALAGWLAAFLAVTVPAYDRLARQPPEAAEVAYEPWSAERLAALRAQGRPVFVNFTAAWCITCQVNEQVALSTPGAAEAFRRTGAAYLKADWTSRDPAIAQALAEHGRAGVPLYLMYGQGAEPAILPQLLTEGMVIEALERATPAVSAGR